MRYEVLRRVPLPRVAMICAALCCVALRRASVLLFAVQVNLRDNPVGKPGRGAVAYLMSTSGQLNVVVHSLTASVLSWEHAPPPSPSSQGMGTLAEPETEHGL